MRPGAFWWGSLLVFFVGTLVSCATVPEKTSPQDGLVIMKTAAINPDFGPYIRVYELQLSADYPSVQIPKGQSNFVAFIVRKSGVRIQSVTSHVPIGQGDGNDYSQLCDIALPYVPGKATVLNDVFVQTIQKVGSDSYRGSIAFRKIEEQERQALLDQLQDRLSDQSWLP